MRGIFVVSRLVRARDAARDDSQSISRAARTIECDISAPPRSQRSRFPPSLAIDHMPLTHSGKIDHKALAERQRPSRSCILARHSLPPRWTHGGPGWLPDPRFVGREGELRRLVAAFDGTRAGHGCLVAVSGDAGIGKTRLVEELFRATALPPGRVFRGRCLDQEGAPSYWPWVRVLRAYVAARGLDDARIDMG